MARAAIDPTPDSLAGLTARLLGPLARAAEDAVRRLGLAIDGPSQAAPSSGASADDGTDTADAADAAGAPVGGAPVADPDSRPRRRRVDGPRDSAAAASTMRAALPAGLLVDRRAGAPPGLSPAAAAALVAESIPASASVVMPAEPAWRPEGESGAVAVAVADRTGSEPPRAGRATASPHADLPQAVAWSRGAGGLIVVGAAAPADAANGYEVLRSTEGETGSAPTAARALAVGQRQPPALASTAGDRSADDARGLDSTTPARSHLLELVRSAAALGRPATDATPFDPGSRTPEPAPSGSPPTDEWRAAALRSRAGPSGLPAPNAPAMPPAALRATAAAAEPAAAQPWAPRPERGRVPQRTDHPFSGVLRLRRAGSVDGAVPDGPDGESAVGAPPVESGPEQAPMPSGAALRPWRRLGSRLDRALAPVFSQAARVGAAAGTSPPDAGASNGLAADSQRGPSTDRVADRGEDAAAADPGFEHAAPQVSNTFNVRVSMDGPGGAAERRWLEESIGDWLAQSARRQGLWP